MNKLFASSVDPNQLSLTFRGLFSFIIFMGSMIGMEISEVELGALADAFVAIVLGTGTLVSGCMTFWGVLRKGLILIGLIKPKQ